MMLGARDVYFGAVALIWLTQSLRNLRDAAAVPSLPPLDRVLDSPRPAVSVVIAVRDEAPRIETTVRRFLAQISVDLEIIVVDDRSTDGTREIVQRLTAEDRRVSMIVVDSLPAGWLGKPHACQLGGVAARSPWILFTDADAWLKADVLRRAVDQGVRASVAHVVLAPGIRDASLLAKSALVAFKLSLAGEMARANRDQHPRAIGIGAFNLVRAEAWRGIGGHTRLRMEVIDDLRFGWLLGEAGQRTRAFTCEDGVSVDWARDLVGIVRALEKNAFAHMRYSGVLAFGASALFAVLWASALVGPFTGSVAGWAAFAALFSLSLAGLRLEARHGWRALVVLLTPVLSIVLAVSIANSAWKTLAQGGVRWRGTLYPLDELRKRADELRKARAS
jgi:glycosyltransferase involved in cell wall biosynthesis